MRANYCAKCGQSSQSVGGAGCVCDVVGSPVVRNYDTPEARRFWGVDAEARPVEAKSNEG